MSIDDKEKLVTMECDHCGCSDEVNPDEEPAPPELTDALGERILEGEYQSHSCPRMGRGQL